MPASAFLTDYLKFHAVKTPSKTALVFEAQVYTWTELWQAVEKSSGFILETLGDKKQSVVSILLTNSPEFVITYLAVIHAGHIAMPLDPAYKKLELDAIIDQIAPDLIITDIRYRGQISAKDVAMVDEVLVGAETGLSSLRLGPKKQIATLTFTSGTTGRPKAAPYTHANHIWNIKVCSEVWRWTSKDSLFICLPLSHWYGLVMGLSGMLYHGNTLYLSQQSFDARDVLTLLSSGNITIFTHTPFAYTQMLEVPDNDYDLSKVRLLISGGGPLAPTDWKAFKKRFGVEIIETYGSSETGRIAANHLDARAEGSPGKVLPEVRLKLSGSGEVLVKSAGVFPGYYKNPQATKQSLDKDGWWHTGDLGQLEHNFLFLKGRVQERIRRFSYTISPRDVEWALLQNPKIREVKVIGRQVPGRANDELIYFISGSLDEAELVTYAKENLLFAWRPDRVIFIDKLPRTTMGKPSLHKLRKMV